MFTYSNNIALNFTDNQKAKELYEKAFEMQLDENQSSENEFCMKKDGMHFWLDKAEQKTPQRLDTFFEFTVENADEARAHLESHGFVMTQKTMANCYMMRDPFGVHWHLFQRKPGKGLVDTTAYNITTIYVSELEESVKFYTEILGFTKKQDMGSGTLLSVGSGIHGTMIYLEGGFEKVERSGSGKQSFSAMCLNAPSMKKAHDALKEAGIPFHREFTEFGPEFAGFEILDPSGNVIEYAGTP